MYTLIGSFIGYNFLAYGIGPAMNYFSSTISTKDITGRAAQRIHSKSATDYYIDAPGLPECCIAKFYITSDEYYSIPQSVHAHVTLKQSFFGSTIEKYSFY
jgi:hypothetical protein